MDVTDLNGILTGYTHTVGVESKPDPTGAIVVGPDGYLPGCGLRLCAADESGVRR